VDQTGFLGFIAIAVSIINFSIRSAVPITLGALSGLVSERSGVVNIGIEGMMLSGAFAAFVTNFYLSQPTASAFLQQQPIRLGLAILTALVVGGVMALVHAVLSIRFKVDQIISGTVINIFATGITGYLYINGITLGGLPSVVANPFVRSQGLLYYLGAIIFDKGFITYLTLILVFVMGFALFHTTWGLRTRSVGENPRAADTLGINVHRLQYTNLAISGMLAGLSGAALVLQEVSSFERGMSNGRGFIALAVMIFGMWRPSRAFVGALLFGFATGLQNQLQLLGIGEAIPHQFVAMLPYILTLVVLAGFVGRARPPAHVGQAYEVE
jgi:general nucleoside transport system permease protein